MLGFADSVRKSFAFLPSLGFHEVSASETQVRFSKDRWDLVIFHERLSFEIGASFCFDDVRYSLGEVLRVVDPQIDYFRDVSARTVDFVALAVANLAKLIQQHALPPICGESEFAEKLERARRELGEKKNENFVRQRGHVAFQRQDYASAAEWYGMVEDKLTAVERKRLLIARQRSK